jgi:hypothetical protein
LTCEITDVFFDASMAERQGWPEVAWNALHACLQQRARSPDPKQHAEQTNPAPSPVLPATLRQDGAPSNPVA